VITGVHAIVYTANPDAVLTFFRDTLGLRSVDAGGGWEIVALPPAELAAHPTEGPPRHQLYLMCDDLQATIDELGAKGVHVTGEIVEVRWGVIATLEIPGGGQIALYEPRHPSPLFPG
jgi:predicted enzyme related to lactoylglutathione lyase